MESVDRIEVIDGSSSSLYGNYAMGGVINIVGSRPSRRTVELSAQYGSRNSPKLDFFGSDVWGKLGVAVEGSFFDTEGFPIVIENERRPSDVNPGPGVDTKAAVNFRNVNLKLDYTPTSRINAFFRGGYFSEERDNGKVSTIDGTPEANDTRWSSASGGVRVQLPDQSDLQARIFTDIETFRSNFLAVPAPPQVTVPRSVGRMTLNQRVPSKSVGGMTQWSRAIGARNYFTRRRRLPLGRRRQRRGRARRRPRTDGHAAAHFGRNAAQPLGVSCRTCSRRPTKLVLTLSARVDRWRNYDAHNLETNIPAGTPGAGNRPSIDDTEDTVGSPRFAALYHITDRVTCLGRYQLGLPRADAQRAVPTISRGRDSDAGQRSARARAAGRWGSGRAAASRCET